jgi:hypothetical protein
VGDAPLIAPTSNSASFAVGNSPKYNRQILSNRWTRRRAGMVLGLAGLVACAGSNGDVKTRSLGNGEFRLECKGALANCLEAADRLCMGNRYEVRSAKDDRDYFGPATIAETEVRTSEAVIWCGPRGRVLFARPPSGSTGSTGAGSPSPSTEMASSAAPVAAPPAATALRACIPGATQVCVGPAACRGGQTCLADGKAFGPCDCGARAPDTDVITPAKPAGSD